MLSQWARVSRPPVTLASDRFGCEGSLESFSCILAIPDVAPLPRSPEEWCGISSAPVGPVLTGPRNRSQSQGMNEMSTHNNLGPFSLAIIAIMGLAGAASAEPFSDDFNSGNLDAWGEPFVIGNVSNQIVSAATGSLRMQGTGSSTVQAENILLPLASSFTDSGLYQNGSASIDLDLDGGSQGGILARADRDSLSALQFGLLNRTSPFSLDRLFISIVVNDVEVALAFVDLDFEASSVRMDASWTGDEYVLTVTDRLTSASTTINLKDSTVTGGVELGVAVARAFSNVFNFGATFDNAIFTPGDAGNPCPADLTADGKLNFFDVQAFLAAFSAQQPPADWNADGAINFFDLQSYLDAFKAGCP